MVNTNSFKIMSYNDIKKKKTEKIDTSLWETKTK